jgi:hypothetical protein
LSEYAASASESRDHARILARRLLPLLLGHIGNWRVLEDQAEDKKSVGFSDVDPKF